MERSHAVLRRPMLRLAEGLVSPPTLPTKSKPSVMDSLPSDWEGQLGRGVGPLREQRPGYADRQCPLNGRVVIAHDGAGGLEVQHARHLDDEAPAGPRGGEAGQVARSVSVPASS
jgi:hypothetical protein